MSIWIQFPNNIRSLKKTLAKRNPVHPTILLNHNLLKKYIKEFSLFILLSNFKSNLNFFKRIKKIIDKNKSYFISLWIKSK